MQVLLWFSSAPLCKFCSFLHCYVIYCMLALHPECFENREVVQFELESFHSSLEWTFSYLNYWFKVLSVCRFWIMRNSWESYSRNLKIRHKRIDSCQQQCWCWRFWFGTTSETAPFKTGDSVICRWERRVWTAVSIWTTWAWVNATGEREFVTVLDQMCNLSVMAISCFP